MNVSGTTGLYAIIGDPIAQAKTPALLNPRIAAAGADAVLVPMHVPRADFDSVLPALMALGNLKGLVVTYPFKERALDFVSQASARARAVGGLNAMRREADGRWSGDIFDGVGLINALRAEREIAGARVLLIGAGGAGRAIGVAFAEAGASALGIYDLDRRRAEGLARTIAASGSACRAGAAAPQAEGYDIVVNATPVGMAEGDGLPAAIGALDAGMTVADIVPVSAPTALMRLAALAGARVVPGRAMTEGQARALLDFFGIVPQAGP